SWDRTMPEELNRIVVDDLSDFCFAPTLRAEQYLYRSSHGLVFLSGDVMVDNILYYSPKVKKYEIPGKYILATLHRPENVDNPERLKHILQALAKLAAGGVNVIFPMHPRTTERVDQFHFREYLYKASRVYVISPVGYLQCLAYMKGAAFVVTDSGGMQVETTVLGIPCLTLRGNTEHWDTLETGTNSLVGSDIGAIIEAAQRVYAGDYKKREVVHDPLWDGKTAERIVATLKGKLEL
ncbi:unnamed protein product, partial [marine sediment metagenome]